jgi:hypothetical protein
MQQQLVIQQMVLVTRRAEARAFGRLSARRDDRNNADKVGTAMIFRKPAWAVADKCLRGHLGRESGGSDETHQERSQGPQVDGG